MLYLLLLQTTDTVFALSIKARSVAVVWSVDSLTSNPAARVRFQAGSGILISVLGLGGCPSSVFCPVLSSAEALTLCWPHIRGVPPLCICLVFWSRTYYRTITAAVQRIANTGNVMPNHAHAGTSTAVARCVANSFNETSQFLENYGRQRNIYLKIFERQDLKYWQNHFVAEVTFHPVSVILGHVNIRGHWRP